MDTTASSAAAWARKRHTVCHSTRHGGDFAISPPRYSPLDWYDAPLLYDIIFDAGTKQEAAFLQDVLRDHGRSGGRDVLEPACGTGRLVAALAARGFHVTGCDISQKMLEFAKSRTRKSTLNATLVHAPMQSFCRPRSFDLAHCLVSTFKYLSTERDAVAHLRNVARSLKPGGIYVLGFHLSDYENEEVTRERWTGSRRGVHVSCTIEGWPANRRRRLERVRSRLIVRRRGAIERYETQWMFRTYSALQVNKLFAAVPQLKHVATYNFDHRINRPASLEGDRLDLVFVLRRNGV